MRSLSRYLLKDLIKPSLLAIFMLLSIIWLMQSLRFLDLIVNKGLDAATFFYMTALLIPSLLTFILPVAVFVGAVYAFKRLNDDNEISPLFGAGLNRVQIGAPAVRAALLAVAFSYALSLFLMPWGMTTFKELQFKLRNTAGTMLLEERSFNQLDGLMVYLQKREGRANLKGLLVHDTRKKDKPVTWMAQHGKITTNEHGMPRLELTGGVRQEISNGRMSVLEFEHHSLDINKQITKIEPHWRDAEERYIWELDPTQPNLMQKQRNQFNAEIHKRLTWPLTPLPLVLIAAAILLRPKRNRKGMTKATITASILAIIYLGLAVTASSMAGDGNLIAIYSQWAMPLLTTWGCWAFMKKGMQYV